MPMNERHWPLSLVIFKLLSTRLCADILRISVSGRMALYDVADIDLIPGEAHGFYNIGQQLARLSHKGLSREILLHARGFAHKHEPSVWVSLAKDDMIPPFAQLAPVTITYKLIKLLKAMVRKLFR
jgi:hypothetical protein